MFGLVSNVLYFKVMRESLVLQVGGGKGLAAR